MAGRLPVFRLRKPDVSTPQVIDMASRIFDAEDYTLDKLGSRLVLRSGSRLVEIDGASGGVWAADEAQLWNPELRPDLPSDDDAVRIAEGFAAATKVLPELDVKGAFRLRPGRTGATYVAFRDASAPGDQRDTRKLDVQVSYEVEVDLGERMPAPLPVVGGGGRFNVTVGDGGRPIAFSGVWREVEEVALEAEVIAQKEADEGFRRLTAGLHLESYDAQLAYYSAPSHTAQEFLYPVYVYRAVARFDDQLVPLRLVTVPATRFGPVPTRPEPQPPRLLAKPQRMFDVPRGKRRAYSALLNPFEAGTSWIGLSGGLAGSQQNAQGFVDELAADGWTINFNWGDANAWESDWRRNDDDWVDAADFVFYTGHANMNGWVLSNPDDGFLDFSETGASPGSPGDRWGRQDLEWAIIAACGPLQDELLASGGGDVLSRWDGSFDGLHVLMGYGAVTFDNTDEGRKIVEYARQGQPLIDAWFRAAREIQPSTNGFPAPDGPTVWVGAMYVIAGSANPRNDHLWGHGSVSVDPTAPSTLVCMWTTC